MIPKYLYRGDSDLSNKRKLRELFRSDLLLTNLSSGGNGREIFDLPITQSISRHVGIGWDKTHFLSFSSDENIAIQYGSNNKPYYDIFDETEYWDFAVFTLDSELLVPNNIIQLETGVYSAQYTPANNEFLPFYSIIIIDVVAHLKSINSNSIKNALYKAERDKEWLILPTARFGTTGEFTSKFDMACISERRFFRCQL